MRLAESHDEAPYKLAASAVDHLVYATPDLDQSVEYISELLDADPVEGGSHKGRGTRNYLVGLGGQRYLEIIGPDHSQEGPEGVWPFELDRLAAPKLVNWAVAVGDLETVVRSARKGGYDPGNILSLSRRTPDGQVLRWRVSKLPGERLPLGGVMPFLVEWGDTRHPTSTLKVQVDLTDLAAAHPQPQSVITALDALKLRMRVIAGQPTLVATIETSRGRVTLQ